jgi:hypothetical protein
MDAITEVMVTVRAAARKNSTLDIYTVSSGNIGRRRRR